MADSVKSSRRRVVKLAEAAETEAAVVATVDALCREATGLIERILYPLYLGGHLAAVRAVTKALQKKSPKVGDRNARRCAARAAEPIVRQWKRNDLRGIVATVLSRNDPDPDLQKCVRCGEDFMHGQKFRKGWCMHCEIKYLVGARGE